jgi:phosphorylated adapter RNA export protein
MTTEPIQKSEDELTQHIADTLQERNHGLIKKIVYTIGVERTQEFLQKTLEIEAAGGQKTADGSRHRSPGGIFFYLVRTGLPKEERKQIWSNTRKKKQAEASPDSPSTEEK